jgi:hypothetical protein
MMDENIKQNLSQKETWIRALYMLLLLVLYSVAEIVLGAVVLFQLGHVLVTGKKNDRMLKLGQSVSTYIYQVLSYQTFNSNTLPYPFAAWPKGEPNPKSKEVSAAAEDTK